MILNNITLKTIKNVQCTQNTVFYQLLHQILMNMVPLLLITFKSAFIITNIESQESLSRASTVKHPFTGSSFSFYFTEFVKNKQKNLV